MLELFATVAPDSPRITRKIRTTIAAIVGASTIALVSVAAPATATTNSPYAARVVSDKASHFWRIADAKGATSAADSVGSSPLSLSSTVVLAASGPIAGDTSTAGSFPGGVTKSVPASTAVTTSSASTTFTLEAWIKTTTTAGGGILNLGNARYAGSTSVDKTLYLDAAGKIHFGVLNGSSKTAITSPAAYNNGAWHLIDATLAGTAATLYIDGAKVSSGTLTDNSSFAGYWRVGGDTLTGWPAAGANYTAVTLADLAVYPSALSASTIAAHKSLATSTTTTNSPPVAAFTMSVSTTNDFSAVLDASTSSDSDGSVASYAWSFPDACTDGACSPTATGKTTTLTVDQPGTYTVSLTVTDNGGATSTATKTINLGQTAPTASFDQGCTALKCVFRSTSTNVPDDSAEPNVVYAWDFGDGTTDPQGAGRPGHTYAKAGTYTVTLALTVGYGTVSSTVTKSVTVTATSTNRPPVAAFTYSISPTDGQTVTFDASTSTDPDGNITYYDWYFANDCSTHACDPTASGKVTIRSFESAQLETVSLSVTDAGGLISTITKTIDLSESAALASDDFNRTVSGGFGTATAGGAWTGSNTTSELSVSPGAGKFSIVAGSTTGAYLGAVSSTNTEVTTAVSVDKLSSGGNGIYLWVIPRRVSSTALYQARVRIVGGAVKLSLSKLSGSSTETTISSEVAAGTIAAGQKLDVVVEATGSSPTTLKALAYVDGTTVPEWQVSAIDSAAGIQSSGSVGLKGYVSSGVTNGPLVASFSSFAATTPN